MYTRCAIWEMPLHWGRRRLWRPRKRRKVPIAGRGGGKTNETMTCVLAILSAEQARDRPRAAPIQSPKNCCLPRCKQRRRSPWECPTRGTPHARNCWSRWCTDGRCERERPEGEVCGEPDVLQSFQNVRGHCRPRGARMICPTRRNATTKGRRRARKLSARSYHANHADIETCRPSRNWSADRTNVFCALYHVLRDFPLVRGGGGAAMTPN